MTGLILQAAFRLFVREKLSVTVTEEKWIVLLLFPLSQKHGKIRNIRIILFFTETAAVNILHSSFDETNIRLFDYINGFYNRNRIHSAINLLSPIQFEKSLL